MPLVEGFGPPWFQRYAGPSEIDFRWEREWRVVGDFSFTLSDIAYGLCNTPDIIFFENLVGNAFPFIDPLGNLQTNKAKLLSYKHLNDLK
jgi:hypothetical protein